MLLSSGPGIRDEEWRPIAFWLRSRLGVVIVVAPRPNSGQLWKARRLTVIYSRLGRLGRNFKCSVSLPHQVRTITATAVASTRWAIADRLHCVERWPI